jgi:glycyl-tRNA synthetase
MSLKPCVAPIKVGIYRLTNNPHLDIVVADLQSKAADANLVCKVDSSSSTVGRRYARADELGIPFGITVDFDSLIDGCVTVRDRDSMAQVRVPIANVMNVVKSLCNENIFWSHVMAAFPVVKDAGDDEEEGAQSSQTAAPKATKPLVIQKTSRGMFSRPNPLHQ